MGGARRHEQSQLSLQRPAMLMINAVLRVLNVLMDVVEKTYIVIKNAMMAKVKKLLRLILL